MHWSATWILVLLTADLCCFSFQELPLSPLSPALLSLLWWPRLLPPRVLLSALAHVPQPPPHLPPPLTTHPQHQHLRQQPDLPFLRHSLCLLTLVKLLTPTQAPPPEHRDPIKSDLVSNQAQIIILLPTTILVLRATQTVTLHPMVTQVKTPITIKHQQIIIKATQIPIRTLAQGKTVSRVRTQTVIKVLTFTPVLHQILIKMVIQPLTATQGQAQAAIRAPVVTTALTPIMTKQLAQAPALLALTPAPAGLCGLHPFQKYLVQVSLLNLTPYLNSNALIQLLMC